MRWVGMWRPCRATLWAAIRAKFVAIAATVARSERSNLARRPGWPMHKLLGRDWSQKRARCGFASRLGQRRGSKLARRMVAGSTFDAKLWSSLAERFTRRHFSFAPD